MYLEHFGLDEAPFSIAPDPRYLFLSAAHREALAHLVYGLRGEGGFVLLTGEVGTGKTTVCRCLLDQVPDNVQVALILNPSLTVSELLATVCDEFGVAYPPGNTSHKVFIDGLNRFLLDSHARGKTTALLIDEAQNLSGEVLEQLRLLTNLETSSRKLLQIVLIGQPELRGLLGRSELRQIAQRITARYHLGPLDRADLEQYVRHRLEVAGCRRRIFSGRALSTVYRHSQGIPRLVNVVCDRALLGAYAQGLDTVGERLAKRAVREVMEPALERRLSPWLGPGVGIAALLLAVLVVAAGLSRETTGLRPGTVPSEENPVTVAASQAPGESAEPPGEIASAAWPARVPEDDEGASRALFAAWGLPAPAGSELCAAAREAGLDCLQGVANLGLLRRLNLPVMLHLLTASGEPFRGTLTGLGRDYLELAVDEGLAVFTVEDLERHWLGDFTLLWRPVPDIDRGLRLGDRGPGVLWLREALSRTGDLSPAALQGGNHFGADLQAALRTFQLRNDLLPDGIAGPKTLILLNQTLDAPGPRLADLDKDS